MADVEDLARWDTVVLNSGGPDMTVLEVDGETETVLCRWEDDTYCRREAAFPAACLTRIT